jgi:hypothetical protein
MQLNELASSWVSRFEWSYAPIRMLGKATRADSLDVESAPGRSLEKEDAM